MEQLTTNDTKRCPFCAEEIRSEATRCKFCGSWLQDGPLQHEWHRSPRGMIAGVCAGLSDEFRISVTVIRLAFVLATIFSGLGLVAYIALWFIMPKRK